MGMVGNRWEELQMGRSLIEMVMLNLKYLSEEG